MKNKRIGVAVTKPNIIVIFAIAIAAIVIVSFVVALFSFGAAFKTESLEISQESSQSVSEVPDVSSEPQEENKNNYLYYNKIQFETLAVSSNDVYSGTLALVNPEKSYPVVDTAEMVSVTPGVYQLSGWGMKLYEEAYTNIDKFLNGFFEIVPSNGLIINNCYVDPNGSGYSETFSDLTTGYSARFFIYNSSYKFSDEEFSYLYDQSYKYGIIQRYPQGKEAFTGRELDYSIYRYVGLAHSQYMNRYRYSLEQYLDKIKTDGVIEYKSELEVNTAYVIYYCSCEDAAATTYISVPAEGTYEYTISGDGSDGFIVTVKFPL